MGRTAVAIELTATERAELEGLAGRRRTAQGLARRARIVLAAAEGTDNKAIARSLGADENTVGKWRRRIALLHRSPAWAASGRMKPGRGPSTLQGHPSCRSKRMPLGAITSPSRSTG